MSRLQPSLLLAAAVALLGCLAACSDEPAGGSSSADAGDDAALSDLRDALSGGDAVEETGPDASGADVGSDGNPLSDTGADAAADLSTPDTPAEDIATQDTDTGPNLGFRSCLGEDALDHTFSGEWEDSDSADLAESDPGHSVVDLIATLPWGTPAVVDGHFSYGALGSDLAEEYVSGFLDTCAGWLSLGQALTDEDGLISFEVPEDAIDGPGRYQIRMLVEGDGTLANGYLLAVPADTRFVVFDIDGTLTTSDTELVIEVITELFGGTYVPQAYADANTVVNAWADAGYEIVYLTGRPDSLDGVSRSWLTDKGFPLGTTHFTHGVTEGLPTEGGVGDYKRAYLEDLLDDHRMPRAYGNATTDIYAYLGAGIPLADVFIIGPNAGVDGTQAIDSYTEHLEDLDIPPANQPW